MFQLILAFLEQQPYGTQSSATEYVSQANDCNMRWYVTATRSLLPGADFMWLFEASGAGKSSLINSLLGGKWQLPAYNFCL